MNVPTATTHLPIVVIGAGPIGLAAAAHLVERGIEPLVLEAGPGRGSAVREWSHVRLFSTWAELVDPAAEKLLAPTGWVKPDAATYPTGGDWAERYLQPLADVLGDTVRFGARVTGVSRLGRDRVVDADRETQPFTVHVRHADGSEERVLARAVIDASGTWSTPSPIGGDGLPALGERAAADRISYRVPDLKDPAVRARYAGKRTAVIGSGASAFTALAYLADLAKDDAGHARRVDPAARHQRLHLRRRRSRPAPRPRRARPRCQGRRRRRVRRRRHRLPHRRGRAERRAAGPRRPRTAAASTRSTRSSSSPASAPTCPSSTSSASASTIVSRPRSSWPR